MRLLAMALLAAGVVHNTAHRYAPEDMRGFVFNITGALFLAGLLITVAVLARHWAVWLVAALLVGHAVQVAGCSAFYMLEPWPIAPGDDLCSDSLGLPLGVLGVVGVALMQGAHRG